MCTGTTPYVHVSIRWREELEAKEQVRGTGARYGFQEAEYATRAKSWGPFYLPLFRCCRFVQYEFLYVGQQ